MTTDGLAPIGARPSVGIVLTIKSARTTADAVMTKFRILRIHGHFITYFVNCCVGHQWWATWRKLTMKYWEHTLYEYNANNAYSTVCFCVIGQSAYLCMSTTNCMLSDNRVGNFACIFVHSVYPSDTIWHQRTWSTLVQVMACCLVAPRHYWNHCWLIINEVLWHSSQDNSHGLYTKSSTQRHLKITLLNLQPYLTRIYLTNQMVGLYSKLCHG